ncbi:hypothetical protein [Lactobacillus sp. B4026]|uniref:hypothetical protein n=1 Tax=Lactobacillus sp. B4026 TaxID=2818035 RepID=UPI00226B670C|nr:hypothetical protein [Lactobacillus sp. B4026]MCX8737267.1 hypothetical protein [Lactobacillus sp. B4026]
MAEWQDDSKEQEKLVDETGYFKQIVYVSNDQFDCLPIPIPAKLNADFAFPFVAEEPKGMNNPKYDWTKHVWVDQDAVSTSVRLTNAEKAIQSAQEQATSVTNENKDLKNSLDDIAKSQTEQSKQMAQMLQLLAPAVAKDGGSTNA